LSILAFMWLALVGKNYPDHGVRRGLRELAWGMGTAAFVALLMALCDHRFTATQYALLSALASFGRVYVGPGAGYATIQVPGAAVATFFLWLSSSRLPGLVFRVGFAQGDEARGSRGEPLEDRIGALFLGREAPAARNVTHFVATSMHTTRLWRSGNFHYAENL